jgi:hypothetical protein
MEEFSSTTMEACNLANQLWLDLGAFTCKLLGSEFVSLLLYVNRSDCSMKVWYVLVITDQVAKNTYLKITRKHTNTKICMMPCNFFNYMLLV